MPIAIKVAVLAWLVCCAAYTGKAQSVAATERVLIGLYGHHTIAAYTAGFRQLPGYGVPAGTAPFADGTGRGTSVGLMADIPFSSLFRADAIFARARLGIRAGYMQYDGSLTAQESAPVLRKDGSPVFGAIAHTLSPSISSGVVETTIGFVPFGGLQIFMGGQFAFPISATFVQTQAVSAPVGARFADPERRTMEYSGDIPEYNSPAISATLGMSHAFALDSKQKLLFVPEVLLTIPLTEISSKDLGWQVSFVRLGVSLLYAPADIVIPRRDTLFLRDTVMRTAAIDGQERVLFAEVSSKVRPGRRGANDTLVVSESYVREMPLSPAPSLRASVFAGSVPMGSDSLVIEERVVHTSVPLLGYIFFDSASAELPARYKLLDREGAASFSSAELRSAAGLQVYYHVLNIIGERLQYSSRATVTLTGCNDGAGERNSKLSKKRANAVRNYLVQVWNITPTRIRVQSRDLPATPSNSAVREGAEENRRVEISFSDVSLARPLRTDDTTVVVKTDRVVLHPRAEGTLSLWRIAAGGGALFSAEGITLPDIVEWRPTASALSAAVTGVDVRLVVRRGTTDYTASKHLSVRRITAAGKRAAEGDRETERYSLLLFPFDGATLSAEQRAVLAEVSQRLSPDDKLTIIGTTDVIGEEDYNLRLSLQRARAVADALKRPDAEVVGAGEDATAFPGDVPEGRFYSRTVRIEVERMVRE